MSRLPIALAALVFVSACSPRPEADAAPRPTPQTKSPAPTPPGPAPRLRDPPPHPAWVIIGAVTGPTMNQLSIEEEVAAVEDMLGPDRGILLYAGGPASRGVLVSGRAEGASTDALLLLVGDLVGGATLRESHYRPLSVNPHEPASATRIRSALARALDAPGDRLTVWLAGHGEQAAEPWSGPPNARAAPSPPSGACRRAAATRTPTPRVRAMAFISASP
jgi:hypothetical protein